jgi:hypothetical protein
VGNWLLTALLLVSLSQIAFLVWVLYQVRRNINQIKGDFIDFVTAKDDKTPSQLAQFAEALSHTVGHAAAIEIKTTLMGHASVSSKQQSGIESDIATDVLASSNPIASMALSAFPTLAKRLTKNPALMELALTMLSKIQSQNNDHSTSVSTFSSFKK